jgi:outer membrane protein assembly factor BamE (lipoprotein component of BamABCDE complex)
MQRRVLSVALTFGMAAGALTLTGCATTEARISQHPEMYQLLSPTDQALVSQGQIRPGMTTDAVWLAWGTPGGPYYYGPFDWSYIPPKFPYPSKGVTFSNGRVVFFRYLPSPPPL